MPTKAQVAQEPGVLLELSGKTFDSISLEALPLVAIEVLCGKERIATTQSDLDGFFTLALCSNILEADSIIVSVLYPDYLKDQFVFHKDSLSGLSLGLNFNPDGDIKADDYEDFCARNIMNYCPDLKSPERGSQPSSKLKANTRYKHYCTGEVKTYNELALAEADFKDWIELR